MLRYLTATLGLLAVGTIAQTATESAAPTSTDDSKPTTHTVLVGWSGFKFTPNETIAKPGDTVEFKFYPPDHSVIRADYEHGCIPYENVGAHRVGFYSEQQFVSGISEDNPVFTIKVNDTEPIFYYCGAVGSCKSKHMIGVINPNENQTLAGHLEFVEQAEFELVPGQDWPSESDGDEYGGDSKAGGDSAGSSGGSNSNSNSNSNDSHHHGLSPGAIAGIAIGGAAVLLGAAGLIYYCGRNGGMERAYRKSMGSGAAANLNGQNGVHGAAAVPPSSPFTPGMEQKSALTPMSLATERWSGVNSPASQVGSPGYGGFVVPNVTGTTVDGGQQIHYEAPVQEAPVELPATTGAENRADRFSWAQGNESRFHSGR
ncbi:hypothetical protein jhhlp_006501 [Lomentospora prolificans]|uniref:Phytocyanin domain-containing protein n=1 Tax=Lomentospora prolificans TaxID=41688 RepID=A0A2N3N620_9PEZI|nr:hypothetical protein jhhlp_006501 [Lomentospora prolificans]